MGRVKEESVIWLVGMMGAGKSTLGPALASRLGRPFVDTDAAIEAEAGCSIAEIFARLGEVAFRALEAEAIRAVPEDAVVALGGGAIVQSGMPEGLAERGTVVYLRASVDQLLARIGDGAGRPLLRGLNPQQRRERLGQLLADRQVAYESAAITVNAGELDEESGVAELVRLLEREFEDGRVQ
jgi:shikimate kinase